MEGRFNGGFFALPVWGAYTWRGLFSEFYASFPSLVVTDFSVLKLFDFLARGAGGRFWRSPPPTLNRVGQPEWITEPLTKVRQENIKGSMFS